MYPACLFFLYMSAGPGEDHQLGNSSAMSKPPAVMMIDLKTIKTPN